MGYFVPIKNIPLLLEAFQIVLQEKPLASLMLVGGGEVPEQEETLTKDIFDRGLGNRVSVRGYVDRGEVARLMRDESDMLVLCSKSETFGCVVAEALASGKPVVVTQCGGPEDIVTDGTMGRVCVNNDPTALAKALIDVSDQLMRIDPKSIRNSAIKRYSWNSIATKLISLYVELCQNSESTKASK